LWGGKRELKGKVRIKGGVWESARKEGLQNIGKTTREWGKLGDKIPRTRVQIDERGDRYVNNNKKKTRSN